MNPILKNIIAVIVGILAFASFVAVKVIRGQW